MNQLAQFRKKIDDLDEQIFELLNQRNVLTTKVFHEKEKSSNQIKKYVPSREKEIINKFYLNSFNNPFKKSIKKIFQTIIGESRNFQYQKSTKKDIIFGARKDEKLLLEKTFKKYCEKKLINKHEVLFLETDDLFEALDDQKVDFIVLGLLDSSGNVKKDGLSAIKDPRVNLVDWVIETTHKNNKVSLLLEKNENVRADN